MESLGAQEVPDVQQGRGAHQGLLGEGAEDGAGEGDHHGRWLDEGRGVEALPWPPSPPQEQGAPSDPTKMSCYDLCPPRTSTELCPPRTSVAVPQPIAESCNELCARQCPDSSAFIQPPPVVVTFPGPILSSFPQQAVVGSSGAPAFGGSLGLGGLYGAGATQASGGLCTFGRSYAAPACSPCALPRYSKKLWDTCGPC
ncbi:LOW QUALITY PROTEIN: scale keratin-like [Serinus canaria]|uniref:LOW QUALITY PROTEIN: scale keratin-like n=1 Tax=Serinus canaria TaxID=9135 RepID=UPI0021CCDEF8|nr:LOW QUALITY PROTEIN: scale keratin-like [Serinus canaria]